MYTSYWHHRSHHRQWHALYCIDNDDDDDENAADERLTTIASELQQKSHERNFPKSNRCCWCTYFRYTRPTYYSQRVKERKWSERESQEVGTCAKKLEGMIIFQYLVSRKTTSISLYYELRYTAVRFQFFFILSIFVRMYPGSGFRGFCHLLVFLIFVF